MFQGFAVARSEIFKIPAGLRETQQTIRATANFVGIMIVLAVILPETYRANTKAATLRERRKTAARAARYRLPSSAGFLETLINVMRTSPAATQ